MKKLPSRLLPLYGVLNSLHLTESASLIEGRIPQSKLMHIVDCSTPYLFLIGLTYRKHFINNHFMIQIKYIGFIKLFCMNRPYAYNECNKDSSGYCFIL